MRSLGRLDEPKFVSDDMARSLPDSPTSGTNLGKGPSRRNALTVDVEDYFQVSGFEAVVPREFWRGFASRVERNTERLLDLMAQTGVTSTFFVLGWTAERYPALIRRIQAAGHELGSHSHAHRLAYMCTPQEFREDTHRAKGFLEDLTGTSVIGYRAPSFSITRHSLWALEILAAEGFEYDSSVYPVFRDRYGIPGAPRHPYRIEFGTAQESRSRTPAGFQADYGRRSGHGRDSILEAPPATIRVMGATLPVGGGGYLRLFPIWLFHQAMRRITEAERQPAILYLHPWELDPDQPRFCSGPWLSRFRHYVNLGRAEERVRSLIACLPFAPLRNVLTRLGDLPSESLETLAAHRWPFRLAKH